MVVTIPGKLLYQHDDCYYLHGDYSVVFVHHHVNLFIPMNYHVFLPSFFTQRSMEKRERERKNRFEYQNHEGKEINLLTENSV